MADFSDPTKGARAADELESAVTNLTAEIERLVRERNDYQARVIPAETEVVKLEAELYDAYERGQRDMLNALLALNPKAAQRLHMVSGGTEETFANHDGKLPFEVVFWVAEVAEQMGIQPREAE